MDDPRIKPTHRFFQMVGDPGVSDADILQELKKGICLDATAEEDSNALHLAAANGRAAVCQALIAAGSALETKNLAGNTPLLEAAYTGATETIKVFLAAGANLEACNTEGDTALSIASGLSEHFGITAAVRTLIAAGAKLETADHVGITPLMQAAQTGIKQRLDDLLAAGADIEARDDDGMTPLRLAVQFDKIEIMEALVARGANLYACDKSGVVAIDCSFCIARNERRTFESDISPVNGLPCVKDALALYAQFIEDYKAPASSHEVYQLLAVTPLADSKGPVDYVGNLRRIFAHAEWKNKEQAESILKDMQQHGTIRAETVESILAATFPPARIRRSIVTPGGMAV